MLSYPDFRSVFCMKCAGGSILNVSVAESPPGVFLYLGYSKKDSIILTRGRMKIQDEKNIPRWQLYQIIVVGLDRQNKEERTSASNSMAIRNRENVKK